MDIFHNSLSTLSKGTHPYFQPNGTTRTVRCINRFLCINKTCLPS
jgi:hypothetical protein